MKRGEVWLVDFGEPSGPEQAGTRPAIIVQDNLYTPLATTIVVVPLTSNLKRKAIPTTVVIEAGQAGLAKESVVLCHQVQARGKARFVERLGDLDAEILSMVEDCILLTLGLGDQPPMKNSES